MAQTDNNEFMDLDKRELEQERNRNARLIQDEDIRWLMSHAQGRRIMSRILDVAGVYRLSYTGDSGTDFREGQRNVGLTFLADVQSVSPDEFIQMLKEHRNLGGRT